MKLSTTLTEDELRSLAYAIVPLRIDLSEGPKKRVCWLDIEDILDSELLPEKGSLLTASASIRWPERALLAAFHAGQGRRPGRGQGRLEIGMSETAIGEEHLPRPDEPPERGRRARSVLEIPWRGWRDVLGRVRKEIRRDNLDIVAAGVTFYAMLAIGPAFVALVSIYGLFASPTDVQKLLEPTFRLIPPGGGRTLIEDLLQRAVNGAPQALTLRAAGAIALSLWSANRGMKALIAAVSLAYEETEPRGFFAVNLLGLCSVAVVVVVLALTSVALVALPALVAGSLIGDSLASLLTLLRWPVLFAVVVVGLSALYRFAPARRPPKWRWVSLGSFVATTCWLLFSGAFSLYGRYTSQARTGHEALDGVIALLLWFWASAWAILLGAELNAELEHQTARDSTVGPPRPLGERGAFVADDIGDAM